MCRHNLGLQHLTTFRTDREERAVGFAAFRAQRRQHDIHDGIIIGQNGAQPVIKASGPVTVSRTDKFIFKTEGIQKRLKARIIMRPEGIMRSERILHRCQRHAEIRHQRITIRNIVRDLAQPVQIIGKTHKACLRAGQNLKGMADHRGPHHLAKSANMRQA